MSTDEQHVALPKLYGAPAYARPPAPVAATPRPFDPDQFPLAVDQTEEDRASMDYIAARAHEASGTETVGSDPGGLRARALSLRSIAGRLLGAD